MKSLILFAKAPEPGRVKTRLSPPLSPEEAAGLHAAFVQDTLAWASELPGVRLALAYEPSAAFPDLSWLGAEPPRSFLQEGSGLGERLSAAFARAFRDGAERVAAIGSDAPHLPARRVEEAFALLAGSDAVLGPALDGGYYLVGLSRPCPALFEGIPWSTDRVLAETRRRAEREGLALSLLEAHYDVDSPADLARLAAELAAGGVRLEATARALAKKDGPPRSGGPSS